MRVAAIAILPAARACFSWKNPVWLVPSCFSMEFIASSNVSPLWLPTISRSCSCRSFMVSASGPMNFLSTVRRTAVNTSRRWDSVKKSTVPSSLGCGPRRQDDSGTVAVHKYAAPKFRHSLWTKLLEHPQFCSPHRFSDVRSRRELAVEFAHQSETKPIIRCPKVSYHRFRAGCQERANEAGNSFLTVD